MTSSNFHQQTLQEIAEQLKSKAYLQALDLSFISRMQLEILGAVLAKTAPLIEQQAHLNEPELQNVLQHFEIFLKGLRKEPLDDAQIHQLLPVIESLKNFLEDQHHPLFVRKRAAEMGVIWRQIGQEYTDESSKKPRL